MLALSSPPRKRFLREARAVAALNHENIVAIHAVEEAPVPYIVMEFVAGRTLHERLVEEGPLDELEIAKIGHQIAMALNAAHAAGLAHRDIKPSNILLADAAFESNSYVKVADFGLARTVDDASLTASGVIAGTPMYMSPEQARGDSVDSRSDLFSLGSLLYHATTGHPPFRGANAVAVLKRVCEDTPRAIADVIPDVQEWLSTIITQLLEKEANDRPTNAKTVASIFQTCEAELLKHGRVTSPPTGETTRKLQHRLTKPQISIIAVAAVSLLAVCVLIAKRPWAPAANSRGDVAQFANDTDVGPAKGLAFSGSGKLVTPTLNFGPNIGRTFEPLLRVDNQPGVDRSAYRVLSHGPLEVRLGNYSWAAVLPTASGNTWCEATVPASFGQWLHVALVVRADGGTLFVDGQSVLESEEPIELPSIDQRMVIGGGFEGVVAMLRVSNEVCYAENFKAPKTLDRQDSTILLYSMDGGDGSEVPDLSGNDDTGRIEGDSVRWWR